jgi:hypothetical protein
MRRSTEGDGVNPAAFFIGFAAMQRFAPDLWRLGKVEIGCGFRPVGVNSQSESHSSTRRVTGGKRRQQDQFSHTLRPSDVIALS